MSFSMSDSKDYMLNSARLILVATLVQYLKSLSTIFGLRIVFGGFGILFGGLLGLLLMAYDHARGRAHFLDQCVLNQHCRCTLLKYIKI